MINEVALSVTNSIIIVNNTLVSGNTKRKDRTTRPSNTKIACAVFISKYLFNIFAITDVPPMTPPAAITSPIPTPTKTPPNVAFITKLSMPVLKVFVKSKK